MIEKIEENTFRENERVKVDIGLDISTSAIGVALLNSNSGNLIKMFVIKLNKSKLDNIWQKADYAQSELKKQISNEKYIVNKIFVEENVMAFARGFSNAKTLFTLAKFNGIVCNDARRMFNCDIKMINVKKARKKLGINTHIGDTNFNVGNIKDIERNNIKTKVFSYVSKINPDFCWEQNVIKHGKNKGKIIFSKYNYDIADAWVICRGGQLLDLD